MRAAKRLLLVLLLLLFLLLFFLLPLCLHYCGGDTVKVTLTILADATTAVVGLFEATDLLERLANLALDRGGSIGVV